jgi:hypothetical protein
MSGAKTPCSDYSAVLCGSRFRIIDLVARGFAAVFYVFECLIDFLCGALEGLCYRLRVSGTVRYRA